MNIESLRNKMGVYQIRSLRDGKVYVGSSYNIASRWAEHQHDLRKNEHRNARLQNAYNKYGSENFVYEVIEIIESEDQAEQFKREQYWIGVKDACNRKKGYNIQKEVLIIPHVERAVVCLETKEIFDSLKEAGKAKNVDAGSISCCCNKRKLKQTGGYHWRFYDEYINMSEEDIEEVLNNKWLRIVCLETGEIFKSYHETGIKKGTIQSCCSQTAQGNIINCFGKHYLYEKDYNKLSKEEIQKIVDHKPEGYKGSGEVICLETGIIYKNARAAMLDTGINDSNILYACYGKYIVSGKFHWMFKKDYDLKSKEEIEDLLLTSSYGKPVVCLETGERFKSATEAAQFISTTIPLMCNVCKGKALSVRGFHFLYKEIYDKLSKEEIIAIMNEKRKNEKSYKDKVCKKVKCIENGEIYDSVTEAANSIGGETSNISKCCKNQKYSCKGYHWKYV